MTETFSVKKLTLVAIFGAIAALLTLIDFPLLFIAPGFYKLDFSEIPVLIAAFAVGPVSGVLTELLKVLLNLLFNGTVTAFVGEAANFFMGCALIIPAGIIYRMNHTRKGAYIGLTAGFAVYVVLGAVINGLVLLPAYSKAFGISIEAIVESGAAIFESVDSVSSFVMLCAVPFNIIKGLLSCIITALIYKKISPAIRSFTAD